MKRNPKIPQKLTDYHRHYMRKRRQKQYDKNREIFLAEVERLREKILEVHLGYIAGLVDGEGTLSFTYNQNKRTFKNRSLRTKTQHPYLEIYNTDATCLNFIKNIMGFGHVRSKSNGVKKNGEKKRDIWLYYLRDMRSLGTFLSLILPYLIIKKQIAEIIYRYCLSRLFTVHPQPPFSDRWYSNEEIKLAKQVVRLQTRGKT